MKIWDELSKALCSTVVVVTTTTPLMKGVKCHPLDEGGFGLSGECLDDCFSIPWKEERKVEELEGPEAAAFRQRRWLRWAMRDAACTRFEAGSAKLPTYPVMG